MSGDGLSPARVIREIEMAARYLAVVLLIANRIRYDD
jgi:hypothetical protein